MKICINKKYQTRNGREVEIYSTGNGGDYPVHGARFRLDGGIRDVDSWAEDGIYTVGSDRLGLDDLIEVRPRISFQIWLNIYEHQVAMSFASLGAADQAASQIPGRLACVPVDLDCEHGEGIDDEDG